MTGTAVTRGHGAAPSQHSPPPQLNPLLRLPPPDASCKHFSLSERLSGGTLEHWNIGRTCLPRPGNQRPRCWDPCTAQLSLGKCQCGNVGHPLSSGTLRGSSTQLKQARPDGLLAITELGADTLLVPAPRLQEWVHLRMFHTHSLATGQERLDLFGNAAL